MTAVEKIKSEFYSYAEPYNGFSEESKWTISEKDFEKLIEQAKVMEKEQIIDAHCDWARLTDNLPTRTAVEYYNETFKLE